MFNKSRRIATIMFLLTLLATLIFAFALSEKPRKPCVLVSMILQFLAFFWYTLSYIPFGRKILKKLCKCACCSSSE